MRPPLKSISLLTTTLLLSLTPSLLPSSVGARHVVPLLSVSAQTPTTQNSQTEVDKLFQEGMQQYRQGYYPKALATYQRVLEIRQQLNDKAGIGQTLNNIGEVYLGLAQAEKASEVLQQALAIRRELKDRKGEGETLDNLGSVYLLKSQYDKALETLQQALAIRQEVKDKAGEGRTLRKIGVTYSYSKQNPKALEIYNQALAIQQEIGDKFQAGYTLFSIASIYNDLEDYPRALECYEKALAASREVGNRFLEGNVLLLIGGTYFSQFKYDRALETSQQALPIFRDLGLRVQEYRALFQIGNAYGIKGDKERAVETLQQSLAIQREIKDSSSELNTLTMIMVFGSKASDLYEKGLYSQARAEAPHDIKLAQDVLQLARELKKPDKEAFVLRDLGRAYQILGDYNKATEFLQQSVNIARQVKALSTERGSLSNLYSIYYDQGKLRQAIELKPRQIEIAREQKDPSGEASFLNTLASTYGLLGEYQKQIELYQQALAKAQEINISQLAPSLQEDALRTLPDALQGLSLGYRNLGEFDKALDFAKQRLRYVQNLKKPNLEAEALLGLGEVYTDMRDLPKAIESTQQALTIARQIKDPTIEANALQQLSQAYTTQGKHPQALELANQALQVAKRLGNTDIEQHTLGELKDIYDNQGNYQKALELAQQRLALLQQTKKDDGLALQYLSHSYQNVGDTQKAIEVANQALAKFRQQQNPYFEGQALATLSQAYNAQGKYEQGIEVGQQSLAIAQKIKNFRGEAWAAESLSNAYQKLGDYQKVISVAEPGLVSARKYKNREREASLLMNLGDAYQVVGDYTKGKEFIEQSLAIARELKNPGLEAQALAYLGYLYNNSNEYQKALELNQQSLKIATELKSPSLQSYPQFNLGHIYRNLGDYQKSRDYYQQALATMRQLKNRQGEGNALLNLARLAEPQQTVEFAQQALTIFQEIKVPGQEVFAIGMLSVGYAALGNDAKAMESAQAFLAFARKTQNPVWEKSTLNFLGQLHRKFGRTEQAIAAYQAALAISTPTEVAGSKAYSLYGLARIYRDLNQPNIAINYYKQSVNQIEEVRRNIQGLPPELQKSFLEATVDFDRVKVSDIYRQLAELLLSQGRDKEALYVQELLRGQEIRDFISTGNRTGEKPQIPLTPTEAKIPAPNQSIVALGRQISECEQTNSQQCSQLKDQQTALITANVQQLQKIDKEIRENRQKDDIFFDPQNFGKIREIVNAQPNTVMIYPLVLEKELQLQLYATGDVIKTVKVPVSREELGNTVLEFRKLMEECEKRTCGAADIPKAQAVSQKLYNWLIQPIEGELKANSVKHLVFALDRVTRYMPMSALFDGKQYLIENYTIAIAPSAALADTKDKLPVGTQNTSVLAMGLSDAVPGFDPLLNVPIELDGIVRSQTNNTQGIYPGEKYLNSTFDFRSLRDNLQGHKILHLATHGVFEPTSSNKSYILLGTGIPLTPDMISALTGLSDIHLVVLSACQTALGGSQQDGVEINALAYYFMNNAAKAVMASLWLVNDASTSLLMQQFYQNLATGTSEKPMTKAEALRQAQLSLLQGKLTAKDAPQRGLEVVAKPEVETSADNNRRSNLSHPYYWAPFILIGNGL